MVTISDMAAEKSKEILTAEGKAEWGLRFYTAGSSCCGPSYGIDVVENPVDGDEVVEHRAHPGPLHRQCLMPGLLLQRLASIGRPI